MFYNFQKMKKTGFLFGLLLFITTVFGQDFNCQVVINSSQVSTTNKTRFETLQQELHQFVNERKWCAYNLTNEERIEATIMIILDDVGTSDDMTGKMTIQVQRPVYKSSYKTPLLNYQDKNITFTYREGDPLDYADNSNLNNLTSLIAYYLNLFLGVEFDSFSLNGGNDYFTKCQMIASVCQTTKENGWIQNASSRTNRYWVAEYFTNGLYAKIHEFYYKYHRLGLDAMSDNVERSRTSIVESLQLLADLYVNYPNLYLFQLICQAKQEEIINIFSEATQLEKTTVINIMKKLDASNQSKYQRILQSK